MRGRGQTLANSLREGEGRTVENYSSVVEGERAKPVRKRSVNKIVLGIDVIIYFPNFGETIPTVVLKLIVV